MCAAILHDFDHPGVNNDFLIKTRHKLAIQYNDVSPLEMSHVSKSYTLLASDKSYDFAAKLSLEDKNIIRAFIIEIVLGTDMKKHFGLVSQFQVRALSARTPGLSGGKQPLHASEAFASLFLGMVIAPRSQPPINLRQALEFAPFSVDTALLLNAQLLPSSCTPCLQPQKSIRVADALNASHRNDIMACRCYGQLLPLRHLDVPRLANPLPAFLHRKSCSLHR